MAMGRKDEYNSPVTVRSISMPVSLLQALQELVPEGKSISAVVVSILAKELGIDVRSKKQHDA
jgi:hypothetical protein